MFTTLLPIFCVICHASGNLWGTDEFFTYRRTLEVTEAQQCERISQAMEDLWDAIPDIDNSVFTGFDQGSVKDFYDQQFRRYARLSGFISTYNTIATPEGRREVACKLAGVHSLSDFRALFTNGNVIARTYLRLQGILAPPNGTAMLQDAKEFANLVFYFIRITGFPHFPLDIYDADMANYIMDRLFEHESTILRMGFSNRLPPKAPFVQALTSDSPDAFFKLTHMDNVPPLNRVERIAAILRVYSVAPKVITLIQVVIEGGFFPTATK